jgi:Na+-transporting methylmalonyl-CoA/oxaloacetate decarboxylase gamma subunit
MERLLFVVLLCLVAAVVGVGVVVYRAAEEADQDRAELACLQRAQATATIALLAPAENVDAQGRLDAIKTLGTQVDAC